MGSISTPKIQHIAVIGAGPSGLSSAKYLLAEKAFSTIQIFEQSGTVQGAWKHTEVDENDRVDVPQLNPYQPLPTPNANKSNGDAPVFTTPMYDNLETNIPHQLMGFVDKPFPADSALYPSREVVSNYLERYAEDIRHLIRFHTQVQDVHFVGDDQNDSWRVTSKDLLTGGTSTEYFDAIAICNGHYDLPHIPQVTGIEQWNKAYPETISHSKFYRSPAKFKGKKVIVVGNSASGMDIANQIAQVSAHPLLISQRSLSWLNGSNSSSEEDRLATLPQIIEYLDPGEHNRAVKFADGRIEQDIDLVLYCTGYLYSFPFLSSFQKEILHDGTRVHDIYQYLFYMRHPSLAFIGLPIRVIPFPLAEVQAAVMAKVWNERLALPSLGEMKQWEENTIKENGKGKKFLVLEGRDFRYHNDLWSWANQAGFSDERVPKRWNNEEFWMRTKFPQVKKAYTHAGDERYDIRTPEELGFVYNSDGDGDDR